jgi:EmrB/QacA subfamily drug resistance transporter
VDRHKRLTLIAAIMGTTVVTVDATVVNVALPAIRADLGGGLAGQQWVSNAYLLLLASLILVGGSLGDLFGERRIFSLGVAGFGAASLLCALSPTIEVLVFARALQGVFGALLTPAALAVIVTTFPPDERGRAVGQWTAWGAIGTVIGPLVGGELVDSASWRWIYAINLPFVVVTLVLVARAVPRGRPRSDAHLDLLGSALCAFGLGGLTFGLIEQPHLGWGSPGVWGTLAGGAAALVGFVVHEDRTPHPMLPLSLFRRRNFAFGNLETFSMYAGLSLLAFFLSVYLQQVAGYSALDAGLSFVPVTLIMFALSGRFGALADRLGPRLFMSAGPIIAGIGMVLFERVDASADYVSQVLPALIVFGIGLSMTVAPLTATVLSDADEHNAGIASGVNNAIARAAGLIAVSAVGALLSAYVAHHIDVATARTPAARTALRHARDTPLAPPATSGLGPRERRVVVREVRDASVHGFHLGMGIGAALVLLGGVLGAIGIRNPKRDVECRHCPGGQLAGVPEVVAQPARVAPEAVAGPARA